MIEAATRWPDPKGYSVEHDEPWPGGRGNHYLFDLERDLFAQSQPETRGKIEVFVEFRPHIVVDLHEMERARRSSSTSRPAVARSWRSQRTPTTAPTPRQPSSCS